MKYIILNDITNIIKKRWPILLTYIIICFVFALFLPTINYKEAYDMFSNYVFGYRIEWPKNNDIIMIGMLILHYGIFILLSVDIFKNDLSNYDNLLERLSLNKWINSKIIVILIISLFINSVIFIFTKIIYPALLINYLFVINKVMIILILICYTYLLIMLFRKNIILSILLAIGIISILFISLNILTINIIYIISILLIILSLLNILSYYTKFSDLKG